MLGSSDNDTYYLEWKWISSDNDTSIGKNPDSKYGLTIEVKAGSDGIPIKISIIGVVTVARLI